MGEGEFFMVEFVGALGVLGIVCRGTLYENSALIGNTVLKLTDHCAKLIKL